MNTSIEQFLTGGLIEPVFHRVTKESFDGESSRLSGGTLKQSTHGTQAGPPRVVVQNSHTVGYICARAHALFGAGWVTGGRLSVTHLKPIFLGDALGVKGVVIDVRRETGADRVVLDMYVENQYGERVTTGTVSGLVHAAEAWIGHATLALAEYQKTALASR